MTKHGIPLREEDLLLIKGPKEYDPQELTDILKPTGFGVYFTTRFAIMEHEFKKLSVEKGVSYLWRLVHMQESALPPGPAQRTGLLALLAQMISKLAPTEDFIIVDPYLLPKNRSSEYFTELLSLLEPIAKSVNRISLVTSEKYDPQLFELLKTNLHQTCPNCVLFLKVSDRYHDRLWIADKGRGLFVGASLNGIGRRYAIADYLEDNDAKDVVDDLTKEGLF